MKPTKKSILPESFFLYTFKIIYILGRDFPWLRGLAFFFKTNKRLPSKKLKTFNDAIYKRKMDLWSTDLSMYTDKLRVREYIIQSIGSRYLIPVQGSFNTWREIDPSALQYPCVLKSNHACANVLFLNSPKDVNQHYLQVTDAWLARDYFKFSGEPAYKNITPQLYIEDKLSTPDESLPDYKFHCFAGKVKSIGVDLDRFTSHKRCHYSRDWVKQEYTLGMEYYEGEVPKPKNLSEMIAVAEKLSSKFKYVRVDLYNCDGRIYFGELTFSHGNAASLSSSKEWDEWLVAQFREADKLNNLI